MCCPKNKRKLSRLKFLLTCIFRLYEHDPEYKHGGTYQTFGNHKFKIVGVTWKWRYYYTTFELSRTGLSSELCFHVSFMKWLWVVCVCMLCQIHKSSMKILKQTLNTTVLTGGSDKKTRHRLAKFWLPNPWPTIGQITGCRAVPVEVSGRK